jgi:hypothetical protein
MTLFKTKMPKFFSKVQGHWVLNGDTSYLTLITCHSGWLDVATGFKTRLQEALAKFQESHASLIDQPVDIGSKPHNLLTSTIENCQKQKVVPEKSGT